MTYEFESSAQFLNRDVELHHLERWWDDPGDRFPLIVYGRRRTGKSWLFRQFAHGKEADLFVCDRRAEADQLASFAERLEPGLGFRPSFPDLRSFFQLLFRQARSQRRLAVIDEFPELMSGGHVADSVLAAVMEEELDGSRLKLLLCGSQVSTMDTLMAERQPLHGRGRRFPVAPLTFRQAQVFLAGHTPADQVERYAIAGGMPLYLRRLGQKGTPRSLICQELLSPFGFLFDEPRKVLEMELSSPAIYFSLLAALAKHRDLAWDELLAESKVETTTASRYVRTLEDLHLVQASNPMFADVGARKRRYRVADPLMRFWFRFVFPYQPELAAGMPAEDHYSRNVLPFLADHAASSYEDVCRAWIREQYGSQMDAVGSWWGLARHDLRRSKRRTTEAIDVVGARKTEALVVGECKWNQRQVMGKQVLDDLLQFKLPALAQTGVSVQSPQIVLFSRAGFGQDLVAAARSHGRVRLVGLDELVSASSTSGRRSPARPRAGRS
jgi:AAA+ ATPase superfamily predicted ATPase